MPIHPIKFRHHSKLVQKLAWHFVFGVPTVINLWNTFIIRYPSEDKTVVRFRFFVIIDDTKRGKGYGKAMMNILNKVYLQIFWAKSNQF